MSRLTPTVDQQEARTFTMAWVEEANRSREQHAVKGESGNMPPTTHVQYLGMAGMFLGRALYFAAVGNSSEARSALIKTVATLFEAWRLDPEDHA